MQEARQDETIIQPWHGSNILKKIQIRKGDMDAGWGEADVIIEGDYTLPYQEHAFLQPEAGLGYIDEEGR
ncbi:MAG: molybdopterin cofactor-binding domain-containing protein, partial [Chloroflexota bacterium]